jgi:hypothetical protein
MPLIAAEVIAPLPVMKRFGRPPSREAEETPAVYRMRAERVVFEPATVHRVREPAVYATRMDRVLVRPARLHFEDVPAVVKTVR